MNRRLPSIAVALCLALAAVLSPAAQDAATQETTDAASDPFAEGADAFDINELYETNLAGRWGIVLAGFELGLQRSLGELASWSVAAEFCTNSAGTDNTEALILTKDFRPFYAGKYFAYAAVTGKNLGMDGISATLAGFANLSDLSFLARLSTSIRLPRLVPFTFALSWAGGGDGKEFAHRVGDTSLSAELHVSYEFEERRRRSGSRASRTPPPVLQLSMGVPGMPKIAFQRLVGFAQEFLTAKGVPAEGARAIAETVVTTEAFGITTHGLAFLAYADGAIPSVIDPKAEPAVVNDRGATAVIDAGRGFAQLAMRRATEIAIRKASSFGIAMVGVRNAGWLAALGVQLLPIAERGMMAQLWAQTNTCKDCAPVGGIDARFSTNPLALAIPTGGDPVVADFSTAAVSMGKTSLMASRGQRAPERIFMDREGTLTDDPRVVKEGGTILFTGGEHYGHKGYGLSLWCEALTAAGGGECNNPQSRTQQNFTLQVIDPAVLGGRDHYLAEIGRFVRHVRSSRPRPGVTAVRLPGARGLAALERGRTEGVDVDEAMLAKLDELAAKLGIASARSR